MAKVVMRRRARTTTRRPQTTTPAITAAATKATTGNELKTSLGSRDDWATKAWEYTRLVGELDYYVRWRSNAVSRARLTAVAIDPVTNTPSPLPEDDPNAQLLAQIVRDIGGSQQPQILKRLTAGLTVPGIGYVALTINPDTGREKWVAVSTKEIATSGARITITLEDGSKHELDPDLGEAIIKIWDPDPEEAAQPTSPVRANLPVLNEIVRSTATIDNAASSRLLGQGLVLIDDRVNLPRTATPTAARDDDPTTVITPPQWAGDATADDLQDMIYEVATTAIKDPTSMAALLPIFATISSDQVKPADAVHHLKLESDVPSVAGDIRERAIRRLALGLEVSPERLLGMGEASNHWCHDDQTEIMVRQRGWIRHTDLAIGDEVLTLNHTTGESEWKPIQDIYRATVVDEPMLRMSNAAHSSLSTAGHRWPIVKPRKNGANRTWTTSGKGFAKNDTVPIAAPHAAALTAEKYSDDLVRLAAAYMSDGTLLNVSTHARHARIAKFDPREIAELRRILTSVFGADGFREHDHPTRTVDGTAFVLRHAETQHVLEICTDTTKALHLEFVDALSVRQCQLLLDAMIAIGDGIERNAGYQFFQVHNERLDGIEYAAIRAGYKVTRGRRNQQTGFGANPLYWLNVSRARSAFSPRTTRQSWETYTGIVWCPVTPNGTWFARRNGTSYFTGNSAWLISAEDVVLHVEPVLDIIANALTEKVLRPALEVLGINPELYAIGYDTTELTQDPDRKAEAIAANASGAISNRALRSYTGFPDEDGYDFDTLDGWIEWARDRVAADPTLLPYLAPLLAMQQGVVLPDFPIDALPNRSGRRNRNTGGGGQVVDAEPSTEPAAAELLTTLCVRRALELAGKRMTTRGNQIFIPAGTPAHETFKHLPTPNAGDVFKLITGWDALCDPALLHSAGLTRQALTRRVETRVLAAFNQDPAHVS